MDQRRALAALDEVRIELMQARREASPDAYLIAEMEQDEARLVAVFG